MYVHIESADEYFAGMKAKYADMTSISVARVHEIMQDYGDNIHVSAQVMLKKYLPV